MNHTLSDIVFSQVKQYLEENYEITPIVLEEDNGSESYPKVIIHELNNVQGVRDGLGFISFSTVQIEIMILGETNETVNKISDSIDVVCNLGLGLKRESCKSEKNKETEIYQRTLIYQAILNDVRNVYY